MRLTSPFNLPALGRRQPPYVVLATLRRPVFLVNSCLMLFTAAYLRRHPLSRSYGVNLPSSFTSVLSSALESSSRLPVSVLVRAACLNLLRAFLDTGSEDFGIISVLALAGRPRLAGRSPSPMRHRSRPQDWCRNISLPSIDYAFRPRLRVRLTLGGFTFPRKP